MHDERYAEWIDLAADGALSAGERGELEAHVAVCADCRRELERAAIAAARVAVRPGFARASHGANYLLFRLVRRRSRAATAVAHRSKLHE